ncbi:MAG: MIP/aquaporin family protein [Bacteroidota bacterium]
MIKTFTGELIGTFILVLFGCGAVAGAVVFGAFDSLFEVAMIWGIGVTLGIFASRNLSQAHLNPAVTVAFILAGRTPVKETATYILGQLVGAFLAGGLVYLIFEPSIAMYEAANEIVRGTEASKLTASMFGEYYPNPGFADKINLSMPAAIAIEVLGTFLLIWLIFYITEKSEQQDNFSAFMIGLTVTIIITLIAPFTQSCLNPARDFAPRMIAWMGGWGDAAFPDASGGWFFVYIMGPVIGGVLAALMFRLTSGKQD